jgi:hypothetical protein
MAAQRKRTIKLYRITDDGRRLLAGTIEAGSPTELVVLWRAFLATARCGTYAACYRGETLGLEPAAMAPMPLSPRRSGYVRLRQIGVAIMILLQCRLPASLEVWAVVIACAAAQAGRRVAERLAHKSHRVSFSILR